MLETIYKVKQKRGYINKRFVVNDTSQKSPNYFNIYSVPTTLTAGKNVIKLGADGIYLKRNYDIDIEVLDVNGEPLYTEYTGFQDRYGYHYLVVYVYDSTAAGVGSLTLVGVANADENGTALIYYGDEHQKEYTVKWTTQIDIKPTDRNITDIIFQKSPEVTISQVLTPYKFNFSTYTVNTRLFTQSLSGLEIITSDNFGLDYVQNTSVDIQTTADIENSYNYFLESSTANSVETNIRKTTKDVTSGFLYSEFSRYNTILYDSQSRLRKDMEGSVFAFDDQDNGASITGSWTYPPELTGEVQSYLTIVGGTGSLPQQLATYQPKIVYVINSKYALLQTPLTINVLDTQDTKRPIQKAYLINRLKNATGSFSYPTSSLQEVQSTNLSSSYIQFTMMDVNPIAGDVYRIKTYAREAGRNAEYYQLNDHIVRPPEFLIDTDKQNQAVYAKNKSDFFTYGEFTTQSIAVDYWRGFAIEQDNIYQYSISPSSSTVLTNDPLANAMVLTSVSSSQRGVASRYYQTYIPDQPYSLSFYCALEAGCELELYMSSTPLKDNVLGLQAPKAFNQSRGTSTAYNKLGKLIGKISNISGSALRHYDNVIFDFFPDGDGFGRPVFYLTTPSAVSKSAYISSIGITPLDLVGYTPSILQFNTTTPDSINILQDDDASLTQSIDVKIEYFTADGKQSEYVTYVPNLQINMINEVPGFCASEANDFNQHCPIYYEIASASTYPNAGTTKPNSGTASLDPTLYAATYFWPTFSLNDAGGYYWNMKNFAITGSIYSLISGLTNINQVAFSRPISGSMITSSWFRYDPYLPLYDKQMPGSASGTFIRMYSASAAPVTYSAAPIDNYFGGKLPTAQPEDRRFYDGDGVAIDKYVIAYSQSVLCALTNSYLLQLDTSGPPTALDKLNTYLKTTRLHFPATSSVSPYGFHENGGIYNVRFKIARAPRFRYNVTTYYGYPDDGNPVTATSNFGTFNKTQTYDRFEPDTGSKLMVYIADVATPMNTTTSIVPGREGFFPPKNNIVTIGNGYSTTPTIRFFDSGSGWNIDQYDLVLVQYGEKAQLVFDASGVEFELDTDPAVLQGGYKIYNNTNQAFWGGIISDIEWCKIGITTDPRFIKPANFNNVINTFVPTNPPPFPAPPSNPYEQQSSVNEQVFD